MEMEKDERANDVGGDFKMSQTGGGYSVTQQPRWMTVGGKYKINLFKSMFLQSIR